MTGPGRPPAGWNTDPSGRHRLRYWDGTQWTAYVSDQGETGTDPIPGADATAIESTQSTQSTQPREPAADLAAAAVPVGIGAPPPSVPASGPGPVLPAPGWGDAITAPGAPPTAMRSIRGLATSLTVLLWITVAVAVVGALAYANRVSVTGDILDFDFTNFGDLTDLSNRADDADSFVGVAFLLMLACSVAIFVLLVIWMWRVAKNAELLGRVQPRFGPGWTIGGWFIPFANLVIPVMVMQDLWRGSDPATPGGDPAWRRSKGSALVGWWWATHVLAALRFGSGGGEADSRSELERLRSSDSVAAFGSLAAIAAAVLLIRVVRGITQRQEALFAAAAAGSA